MAATVRESKPPSIGIAILDRLASIDAANLSPATARELLKIDFEPATRAHIETLMAKAGEGRLSGGEQDELNEHLHVADLLAILHSKARQALKRSRNTP